jgi:hypothetical protein
LRKPELKNPSSKKKQLLTKKNVFLEKFKKVQNVLNFKNFKRYKINNPDPIES